MLLITSATAVLQLVTNTAAAIDVHATWVDTSGVAITPGRQNFSVAGAVTSTIVPSPPANTQRNIKTVHIRNKDVSLNCNIIVQIFDGSATFPVYNNVLNFGDMVELTDFAGFHVITKSY